MLADVLSEPETLFPTIALGDADAAEMVALAALTKPGPFLSKTHLLGGYIGIREHGRLVAMAVASWRWHKETKLFLPPLHCG